MPHLTSTAPASIEVYRRNEYYKSEEEFVFALAEAMRVEYETIADCGFGGRSHPQIAWAKLASLVRGAELASHALG